MLFRSTRHMAHSPTPPAGFELLRHRTVGAPRWGIPSAIAAVGIWLGLSLLLAVPLVLSGAPLFLLDKEPDHLYVVLSSALPSVAMGAAAIVISKRKGNGPRIDFGLRFDLRAIGIGIAAGVGMMIAATIIAAAVMATGADIPVAADEVFRFISDNTAAAALFIVTVVAIAPITEELAYRGIWFGAIERKYSARWAMLISSVMFAALHFEPQRLPILLTLGLALGELRLRTQSLTACIAAHATINTAAAAGMLLSSNLNYFQ